MEEQDKYRNILEEAESTLLEAPESNSSEELSPNFLKGDEGLILGAVCTAGTDACMCVINSPQPGIYGANDNAGTNEGGELTFYYWLAEVAFIWKGAKNSSSGQYSLNSYADYVASGYSTNGVIQGDPDGSFTSGSAICYWWSGVSKTVPPQVRTTRGMAALTGDSYVMIQGTYSARGHVGTWCDAVGYATCIQGLQPTNASTLLRGKSSTFHTQVMYQNLYTVNVQTRNPYGTGVGPAAYYQVLFSSPEYILAYTGSNGKVAVRSSGNSTSANIQIMRNGSNAISTSCTANSPLTVTATSATTIAMTYDDLHGFDSNIAADDKCVTKGNMSSGTFWSPSDTKQVLHPYDFRWYTGTPSCDADQT